MNPHDEHAMVSPYRGLEPFDERDAAFFFGRERESRLIAASLFASSLTLLYGASGVGKSSVLRAGVLPRLRERTDLLPVVFPRISQDRSRGSVVERGWQTDPVSGIKESVALALFDAAGDDEAALRRFRDVVLQHDMTPLYEFMLECSEVSERRLMVILDQFEEYSLYHPNDELFAEQFPRAIVPGNRSVSFLVSLREDALAKLDRFKGRIPSLWDSYRRIDHLERAAAEDAMRLPLREYNRRLPPGAEPVEIEDALVEAVLNDVQTESVQFDETGSGGFDHPGGTSGRIETPYLQLVMTRLWEREQAEQSPILRLETLRAEGGAAEIVRTHLDRVMLQFTAEEQDVAARVFHRLVTPSGAKIAFSVHDLAEYESIDPEQLAPILRRLEEGSRRILRRVAVRSEVADEPRYEIFHDRLGRAILAWRARHLAEQAREESKRHEAEVRRMTQESLSRLRGQIDAAMERLGPVATARWVKMMFLLVSSNGVRHMQRAEDLAQQAAEPVAVVDPVLNILVDAGILRGPFHDSEGPEMLYEVVDDAMAAALLEWHSNYLLEQARGSRAGARTRPEDAAPPERFGATEAGQFPYRRVMDLLRSGRVIPFLGAGVTLSARPQRHDEAGEEGPFLPYTREIKEMLASEAGFPANEIEASTFAEVASYFVQVAGRRRLDELLEQIFGRPDLAPSQTHRVLADVARTTRLVILTTNYDGLMEKALREASVPHHVFAYLQDRSSLDDPLAVLHHGTSAPVFVNPKAYRTSDGMTAVVRLHGPLITPDGTVGSYVITEEDQIEWLRRSGRGQIAGMPAYLLQDIEQSVLLSLGHSGGDWTQRALLHLLADRKPQRLQPMAVALRPSPLSITTWQRYGLTPYDIELNEWAERMRQVGADQS
jgi:hypothetical protein